MLFLVLLSVVTAQVVYNVQYINQQACPVEIPKSSPDAIRNRGFLKCGTTEGDNIFGKLSGNAGDRVGFDVAQCKAVAAAIFPDYSPTRISYTTVDSLTRFTLVESKALDMVAWSTTATVLRAAKYNLKFGPTMLYDGAGIAAKKTNTAVVALSDIPANSSVCVTVGSTTEKAISTWGAGKNIKVSATLQKPEVYAAFANGQCTYIADDLSGLASLIDKNTDRILTGNPLSKEPLTPFGNVGEVQFGQILDAVINGLILAEERGITIANAQASNDVYAPEVGTRLGLSTTFMTNVIKNVGNYAEIYAEFVNATVPRAGGANRLYKDGGLLYPTD